MWHSIFALLSIEQTKIEWKNKTIDSQQNQQKNESETSGCFEEEILSLSSSHRHSRLLTKHTRNARKSNSTNLNQSQTMKLPFKNRNQTHTKSGIVITHNKNNNSFINQSYALDYFQTSENDTQNDEAFSQMPMIAAILFLVFVFVITALCILIYKKTSYISVFFFRLYWQFLFSNTMKKNTQTKSRTKERNQGIMTPAPVTDSNGGKTLGETVSTNTKTSSISSNDSFTVVSSFKEHTYNVTVVIKDDNNTTYKKIHEIQRNQTGKDASLIVLKSVKLVSHIIQTNAQFFIFYFLFFVFFLLLWTKKKSKRWENVIEN